MGFKITPHSKWYKGGNISTASREHTSTVATLNSPLKFIKGLGQMPAETQIILYRTHSKA